MNKSKEKALLTYFIKNNIYINKKKKRTKAFMAKKYLLFLLDVDWKMSFKEAADEILLNKFKDIFRGKEFLLKGKIL